MALKLFAPQELPDIDWFNLILGDEVRFQYVMATESLLMAGQRQIPFPQEDFAVLTDDRVVVLDFLNYLTERDMSALRHIWIYHYRVRTIFTNPAAVRYVFEKYTPPRELDAVRTGKRALELS